MRSVNEILAAKGPQFNSINANATVLEALNIMKCENLSYVIVFDEGKYVGVFSENDYARKLVLLERQSPTTTVREVMSADLPMVTLTDVAEHCMRLMNLHKTRYAPVFDGFNFVGVITIQDLMREAISDSEEKQEA